MNGNNEIFSMGIVSSNQDWFAPLKIQVKNLEVI